MTRAVLDSSCAIALAEAGLLPQLSLLFGEVLLPEAVREELTRRMPREQLLLDLAAGGLLRNCTEYDRASIHLILSSVDLEQDRNIGEAEAIVQANQFGATVLVDDLWARRQTERQGLPYMGSLGVVQRLHEAMFITAPQCRVALTQMIQSGCRLPTAKVNAFLSQIGEDAIA